MCFCNFFFRLLLCIMLLLFLILCSHIMMDSTSQLSFLLMQAKVSFINKKKVIDLYIKVNINITLEKFRRISRTTPLEEFKSNNNFPNDKVKKKTICSFIQQYFLFLQNRKG